MTRLSIENLRKGNGQLPPVAIWYGTPGLGKTTTAAALPNPIFLQTEEGLTSPILQHVQTFGLLTSYEQILDGIATIYQNAREYGWRSFVLDSIDGLDPLVDRYVANAQGFKKGCMDVEYGRGVAPLVDEYRRLMQILATLRRDLNMNVVLIGRHAKIKVSPPDADPYTRYSLTTHEKVTRTLVGESDLTLFFNRPTNVISKDAGFNKTVSRGVSDKPRIYAQETAAHEAKNRYQMPAWIPLVIEDLAKHIPTYQGGINPLLSQQSAFEESAA